jgi:hypothetical protein
LNKLTRAEKKQRGVSDDGALVPVTVGAPPPPVECEPDVIDVWNRKAPLLFRLGKLSDHNIDEFVQYCELVVECNLLRRTIAEVNPSRIAITKYIAASGLEEEKMAESPYVKMLRRAEGNLLNYSKMFKVADADIINLYNDNEDSGDLLS